MCRITHQAAAKGSKLARHHIPRRTWGTYVLRLVRPLEGVGSVDVRTPICEKKQITGRFDRWPECARGGAEGDQRAGPLQKPKVLDGYVPLPEFISVMSF